MQSILDFIDATSVEVKDARITRGEAVMLSLKPNIEAKVAMPVIISDLERFMSKSTGKLYSHHRESYSNAYRIQEPGRMSYGVKVSVDAGKVIIQPIAMLEDISMLKRYAQRIRRLAEEEKPNP